MQWRPEGVDLYSDAKEHWLEGGAAMGFDFPIRAVGGDTIDAGEGTSIPLYAFLTGGWRLRPDEADHTLKVKGGILLVDGGGDPFVDTLGNFTVRVNYQQPVQAITVSTGGGGNPWSLPKVDNQDAGTMGGRVKDIEDKIDILGGKIDEVKNDTALIPSLV